MKTPTEIIAALVAAGYSQQKIAKAAKVSQMTISRWLNEPPKNIEAVSRLQRFASRVLK